MTSPVAPPVIAPPARHHWLWIVPGTLLLLAVTLVLGVTSYFRLSPDTKALRDGVVKSSGVEWRQRIVLNVGSLTFFGIRAALSHANLKPEIRAAVETVRGVEFGLYQLRYDQTQLDRATLLAATDAAMTCRGWNRVVGVIEGDDLVAVYVPGKAISPRRVNCCVLVFDGRQLFIASTKANPQPLVNFALSRQGVCGQVPLLAPRQGDTAAQRSLEFNPPSVCSSPKCA